MSARWGGGYHTERRRRPRSPWSPALQRYLAERDDEFLRPQVHGAHEAAGLMGVGIAAVVIVIGTWAFMALLFAVAG